MRVVMPNDEQSTKESKVFHQLDTRIKLKVAAFKGKMDDWRNLNDRDRKVHRCGRNVVDP